MRRHWLTTAVLALFTGVLVAPAGATPPDMFTYGDAWSEPALSCDGFDLQYDLAVTARFRTFYDQDGVEVQFHERWHMDATLRRSDGVGPALREQYTTTWMYAPEDYWTPTGHGVQYNTVVPGYGPVIKVNGTMTADFTVWPPTYETTAWNVTLVDASAAAHDALCGYFS